MKYFLHDTSAFDDEKISELFMTFGYEGLGLFYTVLERLAKQEKPIKTSILKHQLKVGKKLEKCWKFMESLDIISSNNGDTFNKQLVKFSGSYQIKKEKTAKKVSEWREKQELTKNVTGYTNKCNPAKVKVYKEKEIIKEKNFLNKIYFEKSSDIDSAFKDYLEIRLKNKYTMTERAIDALVKKIRTLSDGNKKEALDIIENAILGKWKSFYKKDN